MDYSGFYKPYIIHVVDYGDDLWTIASKYNVSPLDIMAMNQKIKFDILKYGEEIKIPNM